MSFTPPAHLPSFCTLASAEIQEHVHRTQEASNTHRNFSKTEHVRDVVETPVMYVHDKNDKQQETDTLTQQVMNQNFISTSDTEDGNVEL
jgi:hypothetical protein